MNCMYHKKNEFVRFTIENVYKENELSCNQEEADTKVALHCSHALNCFNEMKVIVRSPSSDTNILVIILSVYHLVKSNLLRLW